MHYDSQIKLCFVYTFNILIFERLYFSLVFYFLALFAVRKLTQMINQMNERYHLSYYFAVPQKNAFFIKTSYQKHFQRTVKRFRKQSFTVFQAIGSTRKFW